MAGKTKLIIPFTANTATLSYYAFLAAYDIYSLDKAVGPTARSNVALDANTLERKHVNTGCSRLAYGHAAYRRRTVVIPA